MDEISRLKTENEVKNETIKHLQGLLEEESELPLKIHSAN